MANIGGRMCVGRREVGWSVEEGESGTECVKGEKGIGELGERCRVMRMAVEAENGNEM